MSTILRGAPIIGLPSGTLPTIRATLRYTRDYAGGVLGGLGAGSHEIEYVWPAAGPDVDMFGGDWRHVVSQTPVLVAAAPFQGEGVQPEGVIFIGGSIKYATGNAQPFELRRLPVETNAGVLDLRILIDPPAYTTPQSLADLIASLEGLDTNISGAIADTQLAATEARAAVGYRTYATDAAREADAAPDGTGARTLTSLGWVHHVRVGGRWRRILDTGSAAVDAIAPRNTDVMVFSGSTLSDTWQTVQGSFSVAAGSAAGNGLAIAMLAGQTLADADAVTMDSTEGTGIVLGAPAGPWYNVARLPGNAIAVYGFPGTVGTYDDGVMKFAVDVPDGRGVLSVIRDGENVRVLFNGTQVGTFAVEPSVRLIGMRSESNTRRVYEFGVRRANPQGYALRNIHPASRIQAGMTIEFLGNSTMYGSDGTATGTLPALTPEGGRGNGGPRSATPLPEEVIRLLAERGYGGCQTRLHAYPGDRTREALRYWPGPGAGVGICVMGSLSINDATNQGGYDGGGAAGYVPLDEYQRNLRTLIVARLEAGVSIVMIGEAAPSVANIAFARVIRRYNAAARDLCREFDIPYVDWNTALTSTANGTWPGGNVAGGANWCDGIHLSPFGNAAGAQLVTDVIAGTGTLPTAYAVPVN